MVAAAVFLHRAWLLPHLLSLDAPLVALVWQAWWAHAAGVPLLPAHRAALGLAVWAIYLADRLADARQPERPDTATVRHRTVRRRWKPLGGLLAAVLAALAAVTLFGGLPTADVRAGLLLALVESGYFALVHRFVGRRRRGGPERHDDRNGWWKEAWVGGSFAVGTALFVRAGLTTVGPAVAVGLFGAACFLNCALITRWETVAVALSPRDDAKRGTWLRPACGALTTLAAGLALADGVAASIGAGAFPTAPVAFGAAGLRLLDGPLGAGWRPETRRVLADAVLLTPLWWLARG